MIEIDMELIIGCCSSSQSSWLTARHRLAFCIPKIIALKVLFRHNSRVSWRKNMKGSIGKKFLTGIWLSLFHGNVCHLGDIHISVFLWHILFDMGFLCDAVILSGAKTPRKVFYVEFG